jgi:hypothetical protein
VQRIRETKTRKAKEVEPVIILEQYWYSCLNSKNEIGNPSGNQRIPCSKIVYKSLCIQEHPRTNWLVIFLVLQKKNKHIQFPIRTIYNQVLYVDRLITPSRSCTQPRKFIQKEKRRLEFKHR